MSKETSDIKIEKLGMEARPYDKVLAKVAELCPAAVQNGKVDFERLKAELADVVDENARETYEFKWVGKNAAMVEANKPIRKTLRPCKEESKNWDATENLYIEGDNLEVLKILEEGYLGKIKMIYIDPPYNTGNDFVYHDNRVQSKEEMNQGIDLFDEEDNRLLSKSFVRNTESSGRFHSDWCSMMYPRLKLARDLLTDDGVIFISIDDNEVANLKKICDEVFGEDNFVEIFSWQKTTTPPNLSKKTKKSCEYILLYQKYESGSLKGLEKNSKSSNGLMNQTNPVQILKFPENIVKTKLEDGVYTKGQYGTASYDIFLLEDTEVKNGYFIRPVILQGKFKWSQEYLNKAIQTGVHIFIQTIAFSPSYEKDEYEPEKPWNIINNSFGVGTNENASAALKELMGKEVFSYPKPISLIKYLINFVAKENDIIMDFFSGSASTAHAVMQLNAEEKVARLAELISASGGKEITKQVRDDELAKVGNRKFIMVQLPENLDKNLKEAADPKSRDIIQNAINLSDQLHAPHVLTEIAKERIRRAGDKIVQETGKTDLDIGFRVLKVDDSNMQDVYYKPSELKQADLLSSIDNIKADRTPLDLLFGVMVEWGVSLSLPLQEVKVGENTIHIVGDNDLVACFDKNVSTATITKMAELNPTRVVFRDSCFEKDDEKINMFEIFKTICHWDDKQAKDNVRVM